MPLGTPAFSSSSRGSTSGAKLPRLRWREAPCRSAGNSLTHCHPNRCEAGDLSVGVCDFHNRSRSGDRCLGDLPTTDDVEEPGSLVLGPDIIEPMADIAPKHE